MTMACNLSIQLASATSLLSSIKLPRNVLQFTVGSMRNWQITNKISPKTLHGPLISPMLLVPPLLLNLSARKQENHLPKWKVACLIGACAVWPPCYLPMPEQTLLAVSAFEISFLQVVKMETAFSADGWTLCDKSHLKSQPALPGDPVLGLCKVKDRPLQPGIYAFKMLISSYETIKYFLQQQQVSTESVLNIWPEVLKMLNNL